jgi:hypothetical protein
MTCYIKKILICNISYRHIVTYNVSILIYSMNNQKTQFARKKFKKFRIKKIDIFQPSDVFFWPRKLQSLCQTTGDARNEDMEPRKVEQQEAMITEEDDDWRQPFIEYLQHGTLPKRYKRAVDQLRKWILRYAYVGNTLYLRSFDQLWLRCVSGPEAEHVMKEIYSGLCGAHQSGPKMKLKIKQMGYYWPTMVADCEDHAKKYRMCQIHGPFIHQAPNPLHPTVAP